MQSKPTTVILYINQGRCGQSVWNLIQRQNAQGQVEVFNAIGNLQARLKQIKSAEVIAVLIIFDRMELVRIMRFAGVFHDVKTILVLPDRKPDTISMGHTLYPRFISYADSDLLDVGAVLDKMLGLPAAHPA